MTIPDPAPRLMAGEASQWLRIVAPHFTAGVRFRGEQCTDAAPILHYARWMKRADLVAYCRRKRWVVEELPPLSTEPR